MRLKNSIKPLLHDRSRPQTVTNQSRNQEDGRKILDKTDKLKNAESKLHDAERRKAELEAKAHETEEKRSSEEQKTALAVEKRQGQKTDIRRLEPNIRRSLRL